MFIPQPHPEYRGHRERGHRSNCNSRANHDNNALRCSDANLGARAGYVPLVEPDAHADSHANAKPQSDGNPHPHSCVYRHTRADLYSHPDAYRHATPDSDLHAHADAYRDTNTNPNARPL